MFFKKVDFQGGKDCVLIELYRIYIQHNTLESMSVSVRHSQAVQLYSLRPNSVLRQFFFFCPFLVCFSF